MLIWYAGASVLAALAFSLLVIVALRRVVEPNEVHIVQSAKKTTSFGKDTNNGNVYYEWPSNIPFVGVTKTVLPVSVFDVSLSDYEAYDKDRVPFVVDITAFFRIENTNIAAQRVANFAELKQQLVAILKGAVRTVLAGYVIDDIMTKRSAFGDQFTQEVSEQLKNWGVGAVKNIELMDIRDTRDGDVIHNIMAKRKSFIEMESRTEVAENEKMAKIAEIAAQQEAEIRRQEAEELVGKRKAEKEQVVGIASQRSSQNVAEEQKLTREKEMAVAQVERVRASEIAKQVAVVEAQQAKETSILDAEGELKAAELRAQATKAEGEAQAFAKREIERAPVQAQIDLAKEIGENQGYQDYLVKLRQVEMAENVGIEQAKALVSADLKIIANGGDVSTGIKSLADVFSSKGGTSMAAMLEGLGQTKVGAELLNKVLSKDTEETE